MRMTRASRRDWQPWTLAGLAVIALVISLTGTARAQVAGKSPRIGVISSWPSDPLVEAFRQGLREQGYVDGRNITLEYRWSEGRFERLPALAADLVRVKVDVIVASSQAAVAARQATATIPIVMPI